MKTTITFECDSIEDQIQIKQITQISDICHLIIYAKNKIRLRMELDIKDDEYQFLQYLMEDLYLPGLDLD